MPRTALRAILRHTTFMTISVYWDVVFAGAMVVILSDLVLEFDSVVTVLPVPSPELADCPDEHPEAVLFLRLSSSDGCRGRAACLKSRSDCTSRERILLA